MKNKEENKKFSSLFTLLLYQAKIFLKTCRKNLDLIKYVCYDIFYKSHNSMR